MLLRQPPNQPRYAYGIICIKTNVWTTKLFILVANIWTLEMDVVESNEYYATEDIDLDENVVGFVDSDVVGYDKFEDTEIHLKTS